jgi:hypothetical protein
VPEQLANFLTDLKEKLSHLLLFFSPQQKRLIFIGVPLFESILTRLSFSPEFVKLVTTRRGFQVSSRTITVTDTLLERSGQSYEIAPF